MAFQQYPQKLGIPSGNTAARPSSPVEGDTYYNGEQGLLEIYSSGQWIPCSAPPSIPTISATDVGTGRSYGSGSFTYTLTAGANGGAPYGYTAISVLGSTTYTSGATTATTGTLVVGNAGSYSVSATAYNGFGTSPASVPLNLAVTTVPQAPTITSATTSSGTLDTTVAWTLNSDGGKNLSAITITPYLNGTTAQTSRTAATTSSTSYTFTGASALTQGASYTFKVKTTNANGDGLESSASNSVTLPSAMTVDYLVIAGGGGGGGGYDPGGGGAGGYRTSAGTSGRNSSAESSATIFLPSNTTVTVGAGGGGSPGGTTTVASGSNGSNSVFSTITSTGGGGGGSFGSSDQGSPGPGNGGCGGGGSRSFAGGSGTTAQGYDGGSSIAIPNVGSGGGGAGAIGGNASGGTPGSGGAGISSSITGSAVTRAIGGNGSAAANGNGGSGSANTGNGAIGGGNSGTGGTGGSGVVILKYPDSKTITIGSGLTGSTASPSGGYKVTTITAGTGTVSWA